VSACAQQDSRREQLSSTWTDNSGNLWLFTGIGLTSTEPPISNLPGYFGELWEYTGTQNYFGGCANSWNLISSTGSPTPRWGAVPGPTLQRGTSCSSAARTAHWTS